MINASYNTPPTAAPVAAAAPAAPAAPTAAAKAPAAASNIGPAVILNLSGGSKPDMAKGDPDGDGH